MKSKHYDNDGRARFVTFSTNNRFPILSNDQFRNIVLQGILSTCTQYKLRLLAFVIMPEHVHLVVVPPEDCSVGYVIGELKRRSAIKILEVLRKNKSSLLEKLTNVQSGKKRVSLWLPRCYDHNCRTEESVWDKVRYCHDNPVKRGLTSSPEKWKWSSCTLYQRIETLQEIDIASLMF